MEVKNYVVTPISVVPFWVVQEVVAVLDKAELTPAELRMVLETAGYLADTSGV